HDNWFIQHSIPSTDNGYYWITSSAKSYVFGYATGSDQIDFASASYGANGSLFTSSFAGFNSSSFETGSINLNLLLCSRDGSYAWPSWKQIRAGQSQAARNKRKNNIIEFLNPSTPKTIVKAGERSMVSAIRSYDISSYRESPITTKFGPLEHKFVIDNDGTKESIAIQSSYGNALSRFDNVQLSNKIPTMKIDTTIYDRLKLQYNSMEKMGKENGIQEFQSIKYSEMVYPSSVNVFTKESRKRENFTVDYWNSSRGARHDAFATNSQGYVVTQSIWPLDARLNWSSVVSVTGSISGSGELQNSYTTFFRTGLGSNATNFSENMKIGALYSRPTFEYDGDPYPSSLTGSRIFAGDTNWSAPDESGKKPFYDSYNDFVNDSFYKGKDYSVVPEFRISEHMGRYVDQEGGNFLADINDMLSMEGGTVSSSSENDFYKTYSHSDFLQHFNVIEQDHKDVGDVSEIKMSCKAVIKLLPYEGFYPVSRTLQLSQLFSQSYGDYVTTAGYTSSFVDTNSTKWRSFFQPFFAPGILYNSIKSGLAVDYPVYMGSNKPKTIEDYHFGESGSDPKSQWARVLSNPFTKRVPFEGLLEPESYVAGQRIWDNEPDASASLRLYVDDYDTNQASYWGGKGSPKYKMAMHNFLAEVPNFYLEDGNLTTFVSKTISKNGIMISPDKANKFFGMDVYVSNSEMKSYTDFYNRFRLPAFQSYLDSSSYFTAPSIESVYGIHTKMYSRESSYGPPLIYDYHLFKSSSFKDVYSYHYSYEPFSPSYFDGFGAVRLLFYPFRGAGNYTIEEIQSNLTASYIRVPSVREGYAAYVRNRSLLEWQALASTDQNIFNSGNFSYDSLTATRWVHPYEYARGVVSASTDWQQISSSVNFLGKTDVKKVIYKLGDEGGKYSVDSVEDSLDSSVWTISTRWETPVLNFANKEFYPPTYGSGSTSKGMWHQYGDDCVDNEGVWFGVADLPNQIIFTGSNETEKYDPTGSYGIFSNRSENDISLKSENAYVDLYLRNPNGIACAYIDFDFSNNKSTNLLLQGGAVPCAGGFSLAAPQYVVTASSFETCKSIAEAINNKLYNGPTDTYALAHVLTASAFKVGLQDNPFENTGSSLNLPGPPSGYHNMGIAGVRISFKDVTDNKYGMMYPDYYASGDLGNNYVCYITSSGYPSATAEPALGIVTSITDVMAFKGADVIDPNKIVFGEKVKFRGGVTRKYKAESLADLLGFQKTQKKIGRISKEKEIREAVVAIPFIENGNNKSFFKIKRRLIDIASGKIQPRDSEQKPGDSIVNMVKSLQRYVLPPKFDFLTYSTIDPFAVYVFEFKHLLTKQDLKDIWQNLTPEITKNIIEQETSVEHKFGDNEIMNKGFGGNVRWLVFKIKQKANWNYFAITADSSDDDRFKFNFNIGGKGSSKGSVPEYNYNWPYDYFSLVDRIKINTDVTIAGKKLEKK
ncbi:MAG: hypothetical protein Q8P81_02300, partial [Nanoarchaeota archaeon]|nr:hypothetical protein [Nanoarchaeota archaeon]